MGLPGQLAGDVVQRDVPLADFLVAVVGSKNGPHANERILIHLFSPSLFRNVKGAGNAPAREWLPPGRLLRSQNTGKRRRPSLAQSVFPRSTEAASASSRGL